MKKKLISLLLIAAMALTLCACGHQHTWVEATCTEPKTCSDCGETEGAPLGHQFSEATYWEAPTCSVCGAVEGEPLKPAFEEQGLMAIDIDDIEEPAFGTNPNHPGSTTISGTSIVIPYELDGTVDYLHVGMLRTIDQSVISSDETHPAKDGYEWHVVQLEGLLYGVYYTYGSNGSRQLAFPDGLSLQCAGLDYYSGELISDGGAFTVMCDGKEYSECSFTCSIEEAFDVSTYLNTELPLLGDKTTFTIEYLVPAGYDGVLIGICNSELDFSQYDSPLEAFPAETLFVRFE